MAMAMAIKIGKNEYAVQFRRGEVVVSGGDKSVSAAVQGLVQSASEEYSPAMGGRAAYIANWVSLATGCEIVSVTEPASEKGVVY